MKRSVRIMGILNVTPDSFSDGGTYIGEEAVRNQVRRLLNEGADIIDVGGESTRPFAEPVSGDEEAGRVIPAIEIIRTMSEIPISIDTTKASVAKAALAAGADMVNDISALQKDGEMAGVVAGYDGPVVIMHMQGDPETMQLKPEYENVVDEINDFFSARLQAMEAQGIDRKRVILDPGIGFGKTPEHNLSILKHIPAFKKHGCRLLVGHSRKSFFDHLLGAPVEERDLPTAVVSALCTLKGVDILRVHAVKENLQAVTLAGILG